jgi:iron complex transport system substrate-binding protein
VRIASLVPSATELLFALGLGDQVVGVTHECDYPPEAATKPHLTRTVIPDGLSAAAIDAAVRDHVDAGHHLYDLDTEVLERLEVDLIATQAVCEVCAVSFDDVRAIAGQLPTRPEVISLDPSTLGEVLSDATRLGNATGAGAAAGRLRESLEERLEAVREAVAGAERPRMLALEWLDPPFVGGHWVPEMVEIAGGENALGEAGERSRTADWEELAAARADLVVVMPCGWDSARARSEALEHEDRLRQLGVERVFAVDAAASFSRPGPRLVEGVELLAHLAHPDRLGPPEGVAFEEVRLPQPDNARALRKGATRSVRRSEWA